MYNMEVQSLLTSSVNLSNSNNEVTITLQFSLVINEGRTGDMKSNLNTSDEGKFVNGCANQRKLWLKSF